MEWWQAIILGLVEGLTEYLPVSSTGHLLVAQRLLGIGNSEAANAYAIVIQGGAIAAVLLLYWRRAAQVLRGFAGQDQDGKRLGIALIAAFLPAAVVGLTLGSTIEAYLFGPWPIIVAWFLGGVVLLFYDSRPSSRTGFTLEQLAVRGALLIGFAQCLALWPGVSRSLATIMGGLFAGLSLAAAVEFSFLLGLITLGAATLYKAVDSGPAMVEAYGPVEIGLGFLAATVSALVAVRWMVAWLSRHGMALFGWWRIGAALIVGAMLVGGVLGEPAPSGAADAEATATLAADH